MPGTRKPLCACGHPWMPHDVEEYDGDGTDTCCVDGCSHPQLCPGWVRREQREQALKLAQQLCAQADLELLMEVHLMLELKIKEGGGA